MSRRFIRNSAFGTIAGLMTTFGSFLSSLLVARILGVEATGSVAFAIWIVGIVTTVLGMGLPFTVTRYLPELSGRDGDEEARQVAAYMFRPYSVVATISFMGLLLYGGWLFIQHPAALVTATTGQPLSDPVLCVLIGLCCMTQNIADYVRGYLRGLRQFDRLAKLVAISVTSQIVVLALGSAFLGSRGALMGYVVGNLVLAMVVHEFRGTPLRAAPAIQRRIVAYAKFRWASEVMAFFVWSRIEVFFLQIAWGPQSVGLFTTGLTLANVAIQGPLMLTWGLLPHFSEKFGNKDLESMRRMYATGTRIMGFLVFPACFGLSAIMPELLPLLFGQAFSAAVPSAIILVCAAAFSAVASVGTNLIWAMERSDVDFYTGIAGTALALLGGLLVIRPFGEIGAAYSRVFVQLTVVGLSTWFLTRRLHFAVPLKSLSLLLVAALLCAAAARLTLTVLHGVQGLPVAILAGAVVYMIAVRLLSAFPPEDVARIRGMGNLLPARIGRGADLLLRFMLGDGSPDHARPEPQGGST